MPRQRRTLKDLVESALKEATGVILRFRKGVLLLFAHCVMWHTWRVVVDHNKWCA